MQKTKFKVGVYAICKNEEKHIAYFVDKLLDELTSNDILCIVDTGSTDNTKEILDQYYQFYKCNTKSPTLIFKEYPYSSTSEDFDFSKARNFALNLLPCDITICVSLDIDEELTDNWRNILDEEWEENLDKLHFPYIYSWVDDNQTIPNCYVYQEKVHKRNSYKWVNRVHERLQFTVTKSQEKRKLIENITLIHHPDLTKKRNYLNLCIKQCKEQPYDYWSSSYLAQEYRLNGLIEESLQESYRFLMITSQTYVSNKTQDERYVINELRASMYIEIVDMLLSYKKDTSKELIIAYVSNAIASAPHLRDVWIHAAEIALLYYNNKELALGCINYGESLHTKGSFLIYKYWDNKYLNTLKLKCL